MPTWPPDDDDRSRRVFDVPLRRRRRRLRWILAAVVVLLLLTGSALLSYYVEALWFDSLGYAAVFWGTLSIKAIVFAAFALVTFAALFAAFWALRPQHLAVGGTFLIDGQPVTFSLAPIVQLVVWGVPLLVAVASGLSMMGEWTTFALYWHAPGTSAAPVLADPIFGRPVGFYLFSIPVWQIVLAWLTSLALIVLIAAVVSFVISAGERAFDSLRGLRASAASPAAVSLAFAAVLLVLAGRVFVGRFERLFVDRSVLSGVNYTDAWVALPGLLFVVAALVLGAVVAAVNAVRPRRITWLALAAAPGIVAYVVLSVVVWYVSGFIVKPNELVRESPYIRHNIEFTRRAFGLGGADQRPFPAESGIDAIDLPHNETTIENIRLWDWRALQDTLRQIQEIRTYYDFPDIDIDRYVVGGRLRQMMVAARELSVEKLPESSRNWINEKLIYTHGYGVTMNSVNGFTPEGLPLLVLGNMPVQSTSPDIRVTRPEIYFGQLTTTDVYVRTRQKEFNYPQGESNSYTTYDGSGGIVLGSFLRRLLLALDRGDVSKLPFSDDVTPESRLLMRRSVRERVEALAPFLTYDPDPYIVVRRDGRLCWLMDGFTSSATFPYARHYQMDDDRVNYLRNSVKVVIDAYDGTVTFYVFDPADPIIAAYRRLFPSLFRDADEMPAGLRAHVRYPERLLKMQAAVFGLYHMRDPAVFYNREDLWSVASQVTLGEQGRQVTQPLEPNFVLMRLPGEDDVEFVEILPFTPSNRNNLIGWIAGRSDGKAYGKVVVYDFPKTRLVDGPLQVEARIDQNPQLSAQLSLWNQQGSHVRRGGLLVIPVGRGLLYAEPIYLQAERSPMPELRLVVLALQDRLAYGPTFQAAMAGLFGEQAAQAAEAAVPGPAGAPRPQPAATAPPAELQALIDEAAADLAEYQRLTAAGRLGDAGQKLEALKRVLDELQKRRQGATK